MAKALFRYLRGELNGFYLTNMHNLMNVITDDVRKLINDFYHMQFDTTYMDEDTIYNLGKFAGVFLPRLTAGEGGYGSMRLSSSNIVGGEERSERGLLDRSQDAFVFEHTAEEEYTDDINTLATEDLKSSMPASGATVKGYILESAENVITEDGDIDESKVVTEVPKSGVAYSNYYGNQFLYVEDSNTNVRKNISIEYFYPLFKVMQYIRYNGANIKSLCKLISIICPDGYVQIKSIVKDDDAPFFDVKYILNPDVALTGKAQRIASFLYIAEMKFPQFTFTEVTE